ncbi:MAG: putative transposase [Candidatus Azotimanducaceae bacterium]|jgi:putative transposase
MSFERKQLIHQPPDWVEDGAVYFITICIENRKSSQLINADVCPLIRDSVAFYQDKGKWWVQLFLLMPDHLHALISFNQRERSMSKTIQSWKRYLNRSIGVVWQRGYFDHRLRNADAEREKASYIRNNPVRAGLVEKPNDWPYVWTHFG